MRRWISASMLGLAITATAQTSSEFNPLTESLRLQGVIAHWHITADGDDLKQLKASVDAHVHADGTTDLSSGEGWAMGMPVVTMYRVTQEARYWKAAVSLHDALLAGNLHLATMQMYAAATFLAEYDATVHSSFEKVQSILHPSDKPSEAHSHAVSADASAWSTAAVVDALSWMPHEAQGEMLVELKKLADTQSANLTNEAQAMRTYALLKAVRLGYLPQGYAGNVVSNAQKISSTNALLASEVVHTATEKIGQGKTVLVDAYFNSQTRKSIACNCEESFHYKWDDDANSGFSFWGRAFQGYGVKLANEGKPTLASLSSGQIYIIASPDIPSKNPHPNYVAPEDVEEIAKWVQGGGVLLLMQNDGPNAEFEHFNTLTERFGIHFNAVVKNHVEGQNWEQGMIKIPVQTTTVFHDAHTAYMKDTCTISTQLPAQPVLRDLLHDSGDVYMAVAYLGKGTVYAVVDPWLYNEYVSGRYLPVEYDQFAAAKELVRWSLEQVK